MTLLQPFVEDTQIDSHLEYFSISEEKPKIAFLDTSTYSVIPNIIISGNLIYDYEKGSYQVEGTTLNFVKEHVAFINNSKILLWGIGEYLDTISFQCKDFSEDIVGMEFILAGNAEFTIKNSETGNEYTFKITQNEDDYNKPHWVQVKEGSEYKNIGVIFDSKIFKHYRKCQLPIQSTEFKTFNWLWGVYNQSGNFPPQITIKHIGKCGRCGRKLTTTKSIVNGLGPVCAKKLNA